VEQPNPSAWFLRSRSKGSSSEKVKEGKGGGMRGTNGTPRKVKKEPEKKNTQEEERRRNRSTNDDTPKYKVAVSDFASFPTFKNI